MEQHPIPQNVTTFQFRLIGDMTIKQFGYLAAGVVLGYMSLKLPFPFFINWPVALLLGFGGFSLAFVPIEERPMDIWITSFLKNIYAPTQYVWNKSVAPSPKPSIITPVVAPKNQEAIKPVGNVRRIDSFLSSLMRRISVRPTFTNPFPTEAVLPAKAPQIPQQTQQPLPSPTTSAHQGNEGSKKIILQEIPIDQAKLAFELKELQRSAPVQTPKHLSNLLQNQSGAPATVRVVAAGATQAIGIPKLTTFPNIVTGIVKDDRGNLLTGILVTVRDLQEVPLRALKTNKLGQFGASTPLPPGTYIVEIEDPQKRFVFDRAQLTVNDIVLPALEILAKSRKQVARDKLAKEIFGEQKI